MNVKYASDAITNVRKRLILCNAIPRSTCGHAGSRAVMPEYIIDPIMRKAIVWSPTMA